MGENGWCIMAERPWCIIGRKLTEVAAAVASLRAQVTQRLTQR
jgi:hypothetical protein